jgi:hypothetical protein
MIATLASQNSFRKKTLEPSDPGENKRCKIHKHVLPAFGSHHLLADHEQAKQEAAVVKSSRSC